MKPEVFIPTDHRTADSQDSQRFQVEPKPWDRTVLPIDHPLFATPKALAAMRKAWEGNRAEQVEELQEVA